MIRPIGLPAPAKKAWAEYEAMGFRIVPEKVLGLPKSARKTWIRHLAEKRCRPEVAKSRNIKVVCLSDNSGLTTMAIHYGIGKSYRKAVMNFITSNSSKYFRTVDFKTDKSTWFNAPDYEFLKWKTYGDYIRRGSEEDSYFIKTLSNGQSIEIIPRSNWSGTSPVKIIHAKENSDGLKQHRVYENGSFLRIWDDKTGKTHHTYFHPTKLGRTLSKALRAVVAPFKTNDEKELLEITLNLKGKPFGRTVERF